MGSGGPRARSTPRGGSPRRASFPPRATVTARLVRCFPVDAESFYADPRIREERGTFDQGQTVGSWSFLDGAGIELRTAVRGLRVRRGRRDRLASILARPRPERGGLVGAFRRAASGGARARRRFARPPGRRFAREIAPRSSVRWPPMSWRSPRRRRATRGGARTVGRPDGVVDSRRSRRAAPMRRRRSGRWPRCCPGPAPPQRTSWPRSLLLAPDRRATHLTRALVRLQHGDEQGARADLAIVADESPAAAALLVGQLQSVLRPFDHWPAREQLQADPTLADLGAGLVRELDEVRAAVGVYATRIGRARAAVQGLIGTAPPRPGCRRSSPRCSLVAPSPCAGRRSPSISATESRARSKSPKSSRPTGSACQRC